jgi:hypothetical protein
MVMRVWLPIFIIIWMVITTAAAKKAVRSTSTTIESTRPMARGMWR